ncbi:MAG TPA: hypothetical protein VF278_10285 [Pirellulales bacterium]
MSAKKKQSSPTARRPNKVLDRLRDKLQLDESDWTRFLTLAVAGFAEFEMEYDRCGVDELERLSLKNVPKEWFSDAVPFSFAARRVFRRGRANLHGAVARYFLGLLDELGTDQPYPGGIGLAWLKLAEAGLGECVHPATMAELAVWHSEEFLDHLKLDEMADVIRLWLTALEQPTAWDVAATLVAANRATRHNLHTFRLFDSLMAADWLASDVKTVLCRALLECSPQKDQFDTRVREIKHSLKSGKWLNVPALFVSLADYPLERQLPGLRRHAVRTLVLNLGAPPEEVIDEFFLWRQDAWPRSPDLAAVTEGVLELVDVFADRLGAERVKKLVSRALRQANSQVRLSAYRVGLAQFGVEYARRALKDDSRPVRKWAEKALSASNKSQFRSRVARKATSQTPNND